MGPLDSVIFGIGILRSCIKVDDVIDFKASKPHIEGEGYASFEVFPHR